jgi:hypothetical protein
MFTGVLFVGKNINPELFISEGQSHDTVKAMILLYEFL